MANYLALLMDADSGGAGTYPFEAEPELLSKTPVRVIKRFMDHVDLDLFPKQHVDYEINACMKNKEKGVITALGALHFEHEPAIPYLLMISAAR